MNKRELLIVIVGTALILLFSTFIMKTEIAHSESFLTDTKYVLVTYHIHPYRERHQRIIPLEWRTDKYVFLYNTFRQITMDAHSVKDPRNVRIDEIFPYSGFYFLNE